MQRTNHEQTGSERKIVFARYLHFCIDKTINFRVGTMKGRSDRISVEEFLSELDPELEKYAPYLRELGFTSNTMLKFLKLKDLEDIACIVPTAHRRMILNAVAKIQSPESKLLIESPCSEDKPKKKIKTDENVSNTSESSLEPKKLFSEEDGLPEQQSSNHGSVYDILLRQKLELQERCTKRKKELAEFTSPPAHLMPLAIPGNRIMSVICARCHHRGHRKEGNKNNASCEFEPCPGYHYCGSDKLHPEFKTERREVIFYVLFLKKFFFLNTFGIIALFYGWSTNPTSNPHTRPRKSSQSML